MSKKSQPPIDLELNQPVITEKVDLSTNLPVSILPGSKCPACGKGLLDYNGLLELECPVCGFRSGGGDACT